MKKMGINQMDFNMSIMRNAGANPTHTRLPWPTGAAGMASKYTAGLAWTRFEVAVRRS